jgi:hypothetical protein
MAAASMTRLAIAAPSGHLGLEGCLQRRDHVPTPVHGETGQLENLWGVAGESPESSRAPGGGLLWWEAQAAINRDELYYSTPPEF